jgi:hypothetical protein
MNIIGQLHRHHHLSRFLAPKNPEIICTIDDSLLAHSSEAGKKVKAPPEVIAAFLDGEQFHQKTVR